MLLSSGTVRSKRARSRRRCVGFLSLCALLIVAAATGCDDEKTCTASSECAAGEMCATAEAAPGPYHCLKNCGSDGKCSLGYECAYVTGADCPECDVIIRACVLAPPRPLR